MSEKTELPETLNQKLKELRAINLELAFPKENLATKAKSIMASLMGKDLNAEAQYNRESYINFINEVLDAEINALRKISFIKADYVKTYIDRLSKENYSVVSKMKVYDDKAFEGEEDKTLYNFGDIYNINGDLIRDIFALNKAARIRANDEKALDALFDLPTDFDTPELTINQQYYNSFVLYLNILKEIDDYLFAYRQFATLFEAEQDCLRLSDNTMKTPYKEYIGDVIKVNKADVLKDFNNINRDLVEQYERKNAYYIKYVDYINSGLFTLSINFINKRTPDEDGNITITKEEVKLLERVKDTYALHSSVLRQLKTIDNVVLEKKTFSPNQYDKYLEIISNLIADRSTKNQNELRNFTDVIRFMSTYANLSDLGLDDSDLEK